MEDYKTLREQMVDFQLVPRGIKDARVLEAMRKVPRHLFMPEAVRAYAYEDRALPIGEGQTISQPYMVAVMTELLDLKGKDKVLEIGTGSGYQTALLAELAAKVYTVERIAALAGAATERFRALHYENIYPVVADGTTGLPGEAPFDKVLITAASPEFPPPLVEQLREGGLILAPVGDRYSQALIRAKKMKGGVLSKDYHTPCVFVPLIGKYGWEEHG